MLFHQKTLSCRKMQRVLNRKTANNPGVRQTRKRMDRGNTSAKTQVTNNASSDVVPVRVDRAASPEDALARIACRCPSFENPLGPAANLQRMCAVERRKLRRCRRRLLRNVCRPSQGLCFLLFFQHKKLGRIDA